MYKEKSLLETPRYTEITNYVEVSLRKKVGNVCVSDNINKNTMIKNFFSLQKVHHIQLNEALYMG